MSLLIVLAMLFTGLESGDWYNPKWTVVAIIAVLFFCKKLWTFDKLLAVTIGYTLLNGLIFSMTPYTFTNHIDPTTASMLALSGLKSVICVVSVVWVSSKLDVSQKAMRAVGAIGVVWLSLSMILDWYCKGPDLNKSLSATALALLLPYQLAEFSIVSLGAYLLAGFIAGGRIGVAAMVMATIAFFIAKEKRKSIRLALGVLSLVMVTASAIGMWYGKINLSGRNFIWQPTISVALESPEMLATGFGLGSYYVYGPAIDNKLSEHKWSIPNGVPIAMHNDYLQCIFELGFIGLTLWLALYARCLWLARKEPWLVAFWVSLAVNCFGNFPHHLGLDAMVIALMVGHSLKMSSSRSPVDGLVGKEDFK